MALSKEISEASKILYKDWRNPSLGYKSAAELAKNAKFFKIEGFKPPGSVHRQLRFEEQEPLPKGTPVNLYIGASGSAKTSTICNFAEGPRTGSSTRAQTKLPNIYIVEKDGKLSAHVDPGGLCDTEAEATHDVELEELLINVIAEVLKRHDLRLGSVFLTQGLTDRVPAAMASVWPTFEMTMGGNIAHLTRFLVTKANRADPEDAEHLDWELTENRSADALIPMLKAMSQQLGWLPLITVGSQNFTEFEKALVTIDRPGSTRTIGKEEMSRGTIHCLRRKRRAADEARRFLDQLQHELKVQVDFLQTFARQEADLRQRLDQVERDLDAADTCQEEKKKVYRGKIREFRVALTKVVQLEDTTEAQRSVKAIEFATFMRKLTQQEEEIRRMESLGGFFSWLAGGVKVARVFGGA